MMDEEFQVSIRRIYIDRLGSAGHKIDWIINKYKELFTNLENRPDFIQAIGIGISDWKKQNWQPHTEWVFKTEGGHIKWEPNRGIYALWKQTKFNTNKTLYLTGSLKNEYTSNWNIREVGNEISISVNIPEYAYYHQTGVPPPNWKGNVPFLKRMFHYITDELINEIGRKVGRKVFSSLIKKIKEAAYDR